MTSDLFLRHAEGDRFFYNKNKGGIDMDWTALVSENDWLNIWERSKQGKNALIFKHSTRCSISAAAEEEMVKFTTDVIANGLPLEIAQVLVVEHRPVSLQIADDLGIGHQSPQVILLQGGQVVWNASHWSITSQKLSEIARSKM